MKSLILVAALAAAFPAFATGNHNQQPTPAPGTTNQGGTGGSAAAIAGAAAMSQASAGAAATAGVVGSGNSSVENAIRNSQRLSATQATSVQQGSVTGVGGAGGAGGQGGTAQAAGNTTSTVVDASSNVERPVPPSYAPPAMIPTASCRLTMGLGGAGSAASGSGGFPIGNDQTCLSVTLLNVMRQVGGFSVADQLTVICKIEGAAELETCKNLKEGKRAEGILTGGSGE